MSQKDIGFQIQAGAQGNMYE